MENKINVAEILKNCPSGMELDCPMFENLEFDMVDTDDVAYPIKCTVKTKFGYRNVHTFTKYGCYGTEKYSKCVIFPKGEITWEGFQIPFKEGDVIVDEQGSIAIYKQVHKSYEEPCVDFHCRIYQGNKNLFHTNFIKGSLCHCGEIDSARFATEEEKKKLFDAIKANGYKWNDEKKCLEKLVKPKFKVGDIIEDMDGYRVKIIEVNKDDEFYEYLYIAKGASSIKFNEQDEWELVKTKFDISSLEPFEKVLVRDHNEEKWKTDFFGFYEPNTIYPFSCVGHNANQCIPFKGNEHLRGTTKECADHYITWEEC